MLLDFNRKIWEETHGRRHEGWNEDVIEEQRKKIT